MQHSEEFGLVSQDEYDETIIPPSKGIPVILDNNTSGSWVGEYVTVDGVETPQGLGTIEFKDGGSATGKFNAEGKPEGNWYIIEEGGTSREMSFPTAEEAAVVKVKEAETELNTNYDFFNNADTLQSSIVRAFSGRTSPISNEDYKRLKVNTDRMDAYYKEYKENPTTENEKEFRKRIQAVIEDSISLVEPTFTDSGTFGIGGNIHEDYKQSVLEYQTELKTYTN